MYSPYRSEREEKTMAFCDHCEGQRFDRAQVLRALRDLRKDLRRSPASESAERVLQLAIEAVRRLEIPHLDVIDTTESEVVH
jgi:hypothetical protein